MSIAGIQRCVARHFRGRQPKTLLKPVKLCVNPGIIILRHIYFVSGEMISFYTISHTCKSVKIKNLAAIFFSNLINIDRCAVPDIRRSFTAIHRELEKLTKL